MHHAKSLRTHQKQSLQRIIFSGYCQGGKPSKCGLVIIIVLMGNLVRDSKDNINLRSLEITAIAEKVDQDNEDTITTKDTDKIHSNSSGRDMSKMN